VLFKAIWTFFPTISWWEQVTCWWDDDVYT